MPHSIYNHQKLRERRRNLRANQTESERLLWNYLSQRKLNGYRFCRQYSIGPYILDFYCPKLRLAIELDGLHHNKVDIKSYDRERTQYLNGQNIRVLRFENKIVITDINNVLAKIASCTPLK